jgi:uncharacterized protein (TIGR02284 family)
MAQQPEAIIDNLIETLKDGEEGFRQAAEAVKDGQLRTLFTGYSQQRARFAGELRNASATKSDESSSVAGALHRTWIGLKSAITRGEEHGILAECERGEDSAVNAYKEALKSDGVTPALRDIISRQYRDIQAAHDEVKACRDATK